MDYDVLTDDDLMAETFLALSELDAVKQHKAPATAANAAKSATASAEAATSDGEYLSGGVPVSLPVRDPKTGDVMKVSDSLSDCIPSREVMPSLKQKTSLLFNA
jgi:hypothetical protein